MNNRDIFYSYLSILGFVAICGLLWFGYGDISPRDPGKPSRPHAPEGYHYPTTELLASHNELRARHRLQPLAPNVRLILAASQHAADMARTGRMTHGNLGNGSMPERVARTGYHASASAENVAMGQSSVATVALSWGASPGHRANILGPYQHMGAAVAYDRSGRPYWCVVFGRESR